MSRYLKKTTTKLNPRVVQIKSYKKINEVFTPMIEYVIDPLCETDFKSLFEIKIKIEESDKLSLVPYEEPLPDVVDDDNKDLFENTIETYCIDVDSKHHNTLLFLMTEFINLSKDSLIDKTKYNNVSMFHYYFDVPVGGHTPFFKRIIKLGNRWYLDFGKLSSTHRGDIDELRKRSEQEEQSLECCNVCQSLAELKKCSKCKNVLYCSKQCQLKDWPMHKELCKKGAPAIVDKGSVSVISKLPLQIRGEAKDLISDDNKEVEMLSYDYINHKMQIIKKADNPQFWEQLFPPGLFSTESPNFRIIAMKGDTTENSKIVMLRVDSTETESKNGGYEQYIC